MAPRPSHKAKGVKQQMLHTGVVPYSGLPLSEAYAKEVQRIALVQDEDND